MKSSSPCILAINGGSVSGFMSDDRIGNGSLTAEGHRVVHGGPTYWEPQRITREMIAELGRLRTFDPEHLPQEILLIEAFQK